MWNDDENLNYFHMLEQQDELKKEKEETGRGISGSGRNGEAGVSACAGEA